MKQCTECKEQFKIYDGEQRFRDSLAFIFDGQKFTFPDPTQCPDCRARRRMVWRNERKLYRRKCDLCEKSMMAMYKADVSFPVYCSDCWWSDKWDIYEHGRDFDFDRPFFEQFMELRDVSPHFDRSVLQSTMENSDYCNHAGYLKNCYLIVNSDESEQCLYGKGVNRCFDCLDCFKIYDSQNCYQAVNCTNCTSCSYVINTHNSSACNYGSNLVGCSNCFFSVNLRNKQYYILNQPVSPKEYEAKVAEFKAGKTQSELWDEFERFRQSYIIKWMQEKQTEDCTGDYLVHCKDCYDCYDCESLENSRYCSDLKGTEKMSHNNQDISYFGMGVDNSYECSVAGYNANHLAFCENVWQSYDVLYSQLCVSGSHDLFGCFALRKGEYSILNKRYSKEEYEKMVVRIIEHMKKTGEWGEFFPVKMSGLSYNESTSHEQYPMSKEEVLAKGWEWHDEKLPDYSHVKLKIEAAKAPVDISKVSDEVLNWALICEKTGKLFQIKKMELAFYRKMGFSLPRYHPDVRHEMRVDLRNPRHLYTRPCSQCSKEIQTTYGPDRMETVCCHECYLALMY